MLGISTEHRRIMVTKPACELIRERWSTDVAPEMWARAAARASTAPFSSISFSADCLKWPIAVGGTESKSLCVRGNLLEAKTKNTSVTKEMSLGMGISTLGYEEVPGSIPSTS